VVTVVEDFTFSSMFVLLVLETVLEGEIVDFGGVLVTFTVSVVSDDWLEVSVSCFPFSAVVSSLSESKLETRGLLTVFLGEIRLLEDVLGVDLEDVVSVILFPFETVFVRVGFVGVEFSDLLTVVGVLDAIFCLLLGGSIRALENREGRTNVGFGASTFEVLLVAETLVGTFFAPSGLD